MTHEEYMQAAIEEGFSGMRNNKGGPFGAVVVSNGKIIGRGCNMVISTNDPTAHAEIVAIRYACKATHTFHLSDSVLYTSCEPCPMCLSAVYWADIKTVYFCSGRGDAEKIGFKDKFIYDELSVPLTQRSLNMAQLHLPMASELFEEWAAKDDKTLY